MSAATEYRGTTDRLPDALAFVAPSRTEFWLTIREYDEPQLPSELETLTGHSSATIYRMLDELESHGLVEQVVRLEGGKNPRQAYRAVDPAGGDA